MLGGHIMYVRVVISCMLWGVISCMLGGHIMYVRGSYHIC